MRVVSGIQSSGNSGIHLGNFLGAIQNWSRLRSQGECFFFIADLHAITQPVEQKILYRNLFDTTALLMSCGIGSQHGSALFSQMMISEHTELQWILSCSARMGWLNRMTQFKDKGGNDAEAAFLAGFNAGYANCLTNGFDSSANMAWTSYDQNRPSVGVGLFSYPVLQAADVLLYDATHVPVGDDQDQHLQLIRDIADKFNHDHGAEIFTKPQAIMSSATRVMSLKNGRKKMSKSDPDDMTRINLLDGPDVISRKFKRATTDTLLIPDEIDDLTNRPEVSNLVGIYAALTDKKIESVLDELGQQGHGVLKRRLIDATVAILEPIQQEYARLRLDEDMLHRELITGYEKAKPVADKKMAQVRSIVWGYS